MKIQVILNKFYPLLKIDDNLILQQVIPSEIKKRSWQGEVDRKDRGNSAFTAEHRLQQYTMTFMAWAVYLSHLTVLERQHKTVHLSQLPSYLKIIS